MTATLQIDLIAQGQEDWLIQQEQAKGKKRMYEMEQQAHKRQFEMEQEKDAAVRAARRKAAAETITKHPRRRR